jgi:acyl dehydratase
VNQPDWPALVDRELPTLRSSWGEQDARLYALGVGAGMEDPAAELQFTTQNTAGVTQQVLPTFAVLPGCQVGVRGLLDIIGEVDLSRMLHASQRVSVTGPLPLEGDVETIGRVTGVWDKTKAVVVETESVIRSLDSGRELATCRQALFFRGYGGWGGERGPSSPPRDSGRAPDHVLPLPTRADQPLIYRLTGDNNPLHSDPTFAKRAGFERPIMHGLCVYGAAGRVLINRLLDGDAAGLVDLTCRFATPVYPGELLSLEVWRVDGQWTFRVVNERGVVVISDGAVACA